MFHSAWFKACMVALWSSYSYCKYRKLRTMESPKHVWIRYKIALTMHIHMDKEDGQSAKTQTDTNTCALISFHIFKSWNALWKNSGENAMMGKLPYSQSRLLLAVVLTLDRLVWWNIGEVRPPPHAIWEPGSGFWLRTESTRYQEKIWKKYHLRKHTTPCFTSCATPVRPLREAVFQARSLWRVVGGGTLANPWHCLQSCNLQFWRIGWGHWSGTKWVKFSINIIFLPLHISFLFLHASWHVRTVHMIYIPCKSKTNNIK